VKKSELSNKDGNLDLTGFFAEKENPLMV